MKLNLFELAESKEELMEQLPVFFEYWQTEIDQAAPLFQIKGMRLEMLARDLAQHQVHYAQLSASAKALMKYLEVQKSRAESKYIKNYNQSPRALGAKEQSQYLQGEREIVDMNHLIVEANLKLQQLEEIVEGFRQMGWMLGHITKLRVAELHEAVI